MPSVQYPENNPEIFQTECDTWFLEARCADMPVSAQAKEIPEGTVMAVDSTGALIPFDPTQSAVKPLYVLAETLAAGDATATVILWGIVRSRHLKVSTGNVTDKQEGLDVAQQLLRYSQIRVTGE